MKERLQKLRFSKSQYERPNKKWVCGGQTCSLGPNRRGRCRATFECQPTRVGDHWLCTRSRVAGGRCQNGPGPDGKCSRPVPKCQPKRSWRTQRGLVTRWVISLTIGVLLVILMGSERMAWLSPGPLSSSHGAIESCSTCHSDVDGGLRQWLASFSQKNQQGLHDKNNEQCQSCHNLGSNPLAAHNQDSQTLKLLAADANPIEQTSSTQGITVSLAGSLMAAPITDGEEVPCYRCHQEHNGLEANITQISDQQCHVCHQNPFSSFAEDHPQFEFYPATRRTRIIFDHVSHLEKYFKEDDQQQAYENGELGCNRCHMPDTNDQTMLVNDFKSACQSCHGNEIRGEDRATAKGISVLTVPDIDIDTLNERGRIIGHWPDFTDASLNAFMKTILAREQGFSAVNETLVSLDLTDLTDASDEQLQAVEELIWIVKGFYLRLQTQGSQTLTDALQIRKEDSLDADAIGLLATLSPDVIDGAVSNWFGDLAAEIPLYLDGELAAATLEQERHDSQVDDQTEEPAPNSDDSILGDDILGADEDILDDEILGLDDLSSDDVLIEDDDILGDDLADTALDESDILAEDDDLISIDSLADDGDLLEEEDILGDSGDLVLADDEDADHEVRPSEDRAYGGGWYRDNYEIYYRPTDHADRFLKAWLDFSAGVDQSASIFGLLSADNAPGGCIACHSIDDTDHGDTQINTQNTQSKISVNWRGHTPRAHQRSFTQFSHVSHINLVGNMPNSDQGCITCHNLNKQADYLSSFDDYDASTFKSNFNNIDNAVCADCHTEDKTQQNCLTCHNYHVGDFPPNYSQISHPK